MIAFIQGVWMRNKALRDESFVTFLRCPEFEKFWVVYRDPGGRRTIGVRADHPDPCVCASIPNFAEIGRIACRNAKHKRRRSNRDHALAAVSLGIGGF